MLALVTVIEFCENLGGGLVPSILCQHFAEYTNNYVYKLGYCQELRFFSGCTTHHKQSKQTNREFIVDITRYQMTGLIIRVSHVVKSFVKEFGALSLIV